MAALLPSIAFVWLGWRLVQQDRRLERQRVIDALDNLAGDVADGLQRELEFIDRELPSLGHQSSRVVDEDAIVVKLTDEGITERSGPRLVYEPVEKMARAAPPDSTWVNAERLELLHQDLDGAITAYTRLAASRDNDVRAGSLVRLARSLARAGRHDEALSTYLKAAELAEARVNGDPADLFSRWARIYLLERLNRKDEMLREGQNLRRDLEGGRWRLDRVTYGAYVMELDRLGITSDDPSLITRIALTEAIVTDWDGWSATASRPQAAHGRRPTTFGDVDVLIVWRDEGQSRTVFAATSRYLMRNWQDLRPRAEMTVALLASDGRAIAGEVPAGATLTATRSGFETGLPWTIRVASSATPGMTRGGTRLYLLIAGLALVAFLLPATGYLMARAVQKEVALVRQQAEFVSAVSHEFRSPLTSIAHLTSLLRRDFREGESRRQQYYEVIARETSRLRGFVETLLDFGRMEAGGASYRLAPLDPAAFVRELVEEFAHNEKDGRRIALEVDPLVPLISGDRDALGRAVRTLIENALKYSPATSPVVVQVGADERVVAIRVIDSGIGIPPDEQPRVFERFFRGAEASRSSVKGTGVGLALAAHVVRAHDGRIQLESAVGAGSTFSVLLPVLSQALDHPSEKVS
jgi:signal transduction histidine kinase